jgi:tryptophanyl-tRNA synthetase
MSSKKRVLSGIQPTADSFQIGNYLGALKQWVQLQDTHDTFYSIVDLHAITGEHDPKVLHQRTLLAFAQVIAAGVDPEKSTLFVQSQVPEHAQLAWVLGCQTGFGEASRMTQFKDKSKKGGMDRTSVGLFTYPILQAADILLYQADQVPVGEDQRQHLELTRDLAIRFNNNFTKTFTVPEPYIVKESAKILDLQDPTAKMSKSLPAGCVFLLDDEQIIMKKFKSAVTDSDREIKFDTELKPGVSNLLSIISLLSGADISELESEFSSKGYGDLKQRAGELVIESVARPFKSKVDELMKDKAQLNKLMNQGAQKAKEVAGETLRNVYQNLGFVS